MSHEGAQAVCTELSGGTACTTVYNVATVERATSCGGIRSKCGHSLVRVIDYRRLLGKTDHWASSYWTGLQVFGLQASSVGPWVLSQVGSAEPSAIRLD